MAYTSTISKKYKTECIKFAGQFLDHNDSVKKYIVNF